jgi:hypothetical protein
MVLCSYVLSKPLLQNTKLIAATLLWTMVLKLMVACPASSILSGRIDSPKLLLRGGWLPHSKCYRRVPTREGENEERDQIDHTTRTNRSR